jgi:predicted PhzF superfamily epimerase YddE/YHI9
MSKKGTDAQPVYVVDAFITKPFTGNPAAVCILPGPAPVRWMQLIAREMNLAETAFLHGGRGRYKMRWFTPTVEVPLCGHATLASTHILVETGQLALGETVRFQTKSGVLEARHDGKEIVLNFPASPSLVVRHPPLELLEAVGAPAREVRRTKTDYLVELESEEAVRRLQPDIRALGRFGLRGAIVTARSNGRPYHFVSRFFAPGAGIDEDPVTGAAHVALAPYWSEKLGRTEFNAYQASARGGEMRVKLDGDRVHLAGRAVTMMRGELLH